MARRGYCTAGVQSGPNPSCGRRGTWKSRRVHPALAVPRQAHRKAGPGETAERGSNKPKPLGNGVDTPTSIRSFIVRKSREPLLRRNANEDRRPSMSASRSRRKDRRANRPRMCMAKVGLPTRTPLIQDVFKKGLSRMKGNLHVRVGAD